VNSDEYEQTSIVSSETEFPRNCGFCKHKFDSRQDRIDHIADHFKQGKCMLDWNDESDEADNSDNNDGDDDDNDNDKPSGDGYDGAPSHPPPQSDPGDFGPHYFGGGDYAGGGSGGGSGPSLLPNSFFQFQLSSKSDIIDVTKQASGEQKQQRTPASPHTERHSSSPEPTSRDEGALRGKQTTPARDDQTSLAGDALSGRLVGGVKFPSQPLVARGVCLSKDGVGLITDAANRLPSVLDIHTDPAGRNTKSSPTEAFANHRTEDPGHLTPAVPDAAQRTTSQSSLNVLVAQAMPSKAPVPSTAVLDTLQHFTPQSFLSVRLLGAGGFSTVDEVLHRATNLRLGRKTLKNRDQTAIEELKKEVSVLQKLRHPHVIRFLGAYTKGDKMSILVAPVAETTLALWLEQVTLQQPANLANVISKMFGCLVSSVRYLHEQRPVVKHMDIKPQNILVAQGDQEFPHVVLCDFGISSSDEDLADGQHKPLTRRYVAPEVFDGFTRKQAADIWSLGCVFAEMASAPFGQSNSNWLNFRREYSGRTGKHYWQDVPSLQDRLSSFLKDAATPTEQQVVGTLKEMLNADPNERPSAALLSLSFTPAPCCLEWPNDNAAFPAPDQELEAVEVLVSKDGSDCCNHHLQTASAAVDPCADLFKNAKGWIEDCSHTHDACRQYAPADGTLPTRLVDTQPQGVGDSIVRVVDSATIAQGSEAVQYATLSYVWGKADITLTSDQLQHVQLGLQRQTLSEPLESGIKAAQKLGFRYVWVDSLCILQDSDEDKRSECANMASVFRNAALTIVLDQITKHRSENLGIVLPNANANAPLQAVNGSIVPPSVTSTLPVTNFATPAFGWDTRAWALQERLLSRRLLHLCETQLYWECASLKASDTFPRGLSSLVWEKAHSKSHHDRPQRGKAGSKSVIIKNTSDMFHSGKSGSESVKNPFDKQTPLEATRLRNCQWIHKEGDHSGDSMDVAHTTLQPGDAKAPLSSKGHFHATYARKNSGVGVAPSTKSAVTAISDTNGSGPRTGTAAHNDRTLSDRSTSPYLKGFFGLSSLSDNRTLPVNLSGASKPVGPQSCPTDAHPALSKAKRGSEIDDSLRARRPIDLHRHSEYLAARSNGNATPHASSNCVGTNAPGFWDSDCRSCMEHRGNINVSVTGLKTSRTTDLVPALNDNVNAGLTEHPLSDSLANTLAHQLASCKHSHPCTFGSAGFAEEDGTKI
jgi:serine/threonine protein kinase